MKAAALVHQLYRIIYSLLPLLVSRKFPVCSRLLLVFALKVYSIWKTMNQKFRVSGKHLNLEIGS